MKNFKKKVQAKAMDGLMKAEPPEESKASCANALPRRAESARNALIRYIHDHALGQGDRLPAYAELRTQFGFGSDTIALAVESLCNLGVLEVRNKIGLFVVDPNGGQLTGRTIGVVVRTIFGSAYAATLASFLQKGLNEHNCRCMTFFQSTSPLESPRPGLEEIPGLQQALREHLCDGIITLVPFSDAVQSEIASLGIPCCFIGDDDADVMPLSVLLGAKKFVQDAANALRSYGCRRLVQFCATPEQMRQRQHELPALVGSSYLGGVRIARELLKMPVSRRPDGIVSDDDTIVSGFLAELLTAQPLSGEKRYLPYIATIVHTELGEQYPSCRMILFRQNIEEYSGMAVDLLIRVLRHLENTSKKMYYHFISPDSVVPNT